MATNGHNGHANGYNKTQDTAAFLKPYRSIYYNCLFDGGSKDQGRAEIRTQVKLQLFGSAVLSEFQQWVLQRQTDYIWWQLTHPQNEEAAQKRKQTRFLHRYAQEVVGVRPDTIDAANAAGNWASQQTRDKRGADFTPKGSGITADQILAKIKASKQIGH